MKKIIAQLLSQVSELRRQGVISDDDRAELKELIFSHDPRLCSTSLHEQEDLPRQVRQRLLAVLESAEANAAAEQIDLDDEQGGCATLACA